MKEYMPADIAARVPGTAQVIPLTGCQDSFERFRDRFLDEAKIIYRYQGHPNIVRVQHLFYDNNTAYYVMEFINGMDFGKVLARSGQRLSWDTLRPIMSQVAAALREVHRSGIIHCDISPDNIFILNGGQVKLIDFGAAKSTLGGQSSIILMKRGYAPPEQLSVQGHLGPWTDVYAMAVTIYRAYTGKMPPNAEERLLSDRTLWPSQLGVAAPTPQWEYALRKAMALRIEDRYQSVTDFWSALTGSIGQNATPLLLRGIQGYWRDAEIPIQGELLFGTDHTRCRIAFPSGFPGISRVHMRAWYDRQTLMIMDMGSSYGTWLNEQRLSPGLAYPLQPGSTIYLGDGQIFRAVPQESK